MIKLEEALKAEMQSGEAQIIAQVDSMKVLVEHLGKTYIVFPLGSPDLDIKSFNPFPNLATPPPPHVEATDLT